MCGLDEISTFGRWQSRPLPLNDSAAGRFCFPVCPSREGFPGFRSGGKCIFGPITSRPSFVRGPGRKKLSRPSSDMRFTVLSGNWILFFFSAIPGFLVPAKKAWSARVVNVFVSPRFHAPMFRRPGGFFVYLFGVSPALCLRGKMRTRRGRAASLFARPCAGAAFPSTPLFASFESNAEN